MAILTEVCGDPNPTLEPGTLASSATPHSAPRVGNGIPMSRGL